MHDGDVKISDFGLSKNLNSTMTSNNGIIGIIPFIDRQKLIHENFGKKKRIGYGGSGLVFKTTCESRGIVAIKEVNMTDDDKICTKLTNLLINEVFNCYFIKFLHD